MTRDEIKQFLGHNPSDYELELYQKAFGKPRDSKNMQSFKDWAMIIGISVAMLVVIFLVMNGIQAVVIDTGRAILH